MNGRGNRLWLALRFRDLPLSALPDGTDDGSGAIVVVEKRRVVFCNIAARKAGIVRGTDLATAQLLSNCRVFQRDRQRELNTLHQLRDDLYQFTPHIDIQQSRHTPQSGLLLEISTCLRLFRGLQNLYHRVQTYLQGASLDVRAGLGHTAQGAWLLSFTHYDIAGPETCATENTAVFIERLHRLPVQVLQDYPEAVNALTQMGFTTLGDIAQQIQSSAVSSLAKRLGRDFAQAIMDIYDIGSNFNQAGLFNRPAPTYVPEELFERQVQFDFPVIAIDYLKPAIESLLQDLSEFMHLRHLACQHIQWRLSDIYRRLDCVDVYSDVPQSGWQLLYDLTLIHLENKPIPFEVDCLTLVYRNKLPRQTASSPLNLSGQHRQHGDTQDLAIAMAKLKTRLGDDAVHKVSYKDSLIPELSHTIVALAEKCCQQLPDIHRHSLRPNWLFSPPTAIGHRGERLYWQGYLALMAGPERVTGHWWDNPVARDYYLARRQDNVAVWVYQDLYDRQWYVHGVFS